MHKKGFSLIECLIYISISILLVQLSVRLFLASNHVCQKFIDQGQQTMSLHTALDFISRDIHTHAVGGGHIDVARQNALVYQCASGVCRGWLLEKGILYYGKGEYDFTLGQWVSAARSKVAQGIKTLRYQLLTQNSKGIGLEIALTSTYCQLHKKIYFFNRVVV